MLKVVARIVSTHAGFEDGERLIVLGFQQADGNPRLPSSFLHRGGGLAASRTLTGYYMNKDSKRK